MYIQKLKASSSFYPSERSGTDIGRNSSSALSEPNTLTSQHPHHEGLDIDRSQDNDSSSSTWFGRWPHEAWTEQWGSETGKGRQPIMVELSNGLHSGQLKLQPTGEPWGTLWHTPQRESCDIYLSVPACQCLRTALPWAVMSSALCQPLSMAKGPPDQRAPGFKKAGFKKALIVVVRSCQWACVGTHGHKQQRLLWRP